MVLLCVQLRATVYRSGCLLSLLSRTMCQLSDKEAEDVRRVSQGYDVPLRRTQHHIRSQSETVPRDKQGPFAPTMAIGWLSTVAAAVRILNCTGMSGSLFKMPVRCCDQDGAAGFSTLRRLLYYLLGHRFITRTGKHTQCTTLARKYPRCSRLFFIT